MTTPEDNQQHPSKLPALYSLTAIGLATFISSVLAAGFMLAANYAALGQVRMAKLVMAGSVLALIGFVTIFAGVPQNLFWVTVVGLAQVFVALIATHWLQGPMFSSFEEMGGQYHSLWRAALVGIIAALASFMAAMVLVAVWISLTNPELAQTAGVR